MAWEVKDGTSYFLFRVQITHLLRHVYVQSHLVFLLILLLTMEVEVRHKRQKSRKIRVVSWERISVPSSAILTL